MATDGPGAPPPCDVEIFRNGQPIAALTGSSYLVERWVRKMAYVANARIDWHYSAGVAQVLHLGDDQSRARVIAAMQLFESEFDGSILKFYEIGDVGLYRQGVTEAPEGAVAGFYEGGSGTTYIIRDQ